MITLFPKIKRSLPEHADKVLIWRGVPVPYTTADMPTEAVRYYANRAIQIDYDNDIPQVKVIYRDQVVMLGDLYEFNPEVDFLVDLELPDVGNFVVWSEELSYYQVLPPTLTHESRARQTKEDLKLGPEAYRRLCAQISEGLIDAVAKHNETKIRINSGIN